MKPTQYLSILTLLVPALFLKPMPGVADESVAREVVLVQAGNATQALEPGDRWETQGDALVGSGVGHTLRPPLQIGEGDFTISIRLSLDGLDRTAASFVVNHDSHFGFDGSAGTLFIEGPLFGQSTNLDRASDHLVAGEAFDFSVKRTDGTLRFAINHKVVHEVITGDVALGTIALRPHRSTMRVRAWEVAGDVHRVEMPELIDVFRTGEDGYHTFRIPAIVRAANGDLLAFAEGRVSGQSDAGDIDLVMKRSSDGGATWGRLTRVADFGRGTVGNPAPVVDTQSGDVVLVAVLQPEGVHEGHIRHGEGYRDPCVLRSTDHGVTWSEPVSLVETADRPDWRWYATGPCHAIQLRHGPHAGRLVVPANFSTDGGAGSDYLGAHALLSDDAGQTWRIGAVDDSHVGDNRINPNESTVVELADGTLLFNARDQHGSSRATRLSTRSTDGGESFTRPYAPVEDLTAPVCQGALLGVELDGQQVIVYSSPGVWNAREEMKLRYSTDQGATWQDGPTLYTGSSAYSDLVNLDNATVGCLFEIDNYERIVFTTLGVETSQAE
ncbi:MAG: exo-alpha-sialidase [Phycisphaerales bacterium JB063]